MTLRSIAARGIAGDRTYPKRLTAARAAERSYARRFKSYAPWKAELDAEWDYRFYRFVTNRIKVFDEREFGGAVFVTADVARRR